FLKNKARKSSQRIEIRVFCAVIEGSSNCIGYYALKVGSDSVPEAEKRKRGYISNHVAFPAVHLSYIAVDESYQRKGLGKFLLSDVFDKVYNISEMAGLFALTLESINLDTTSFYKSIGFTEYEEGTNSPKMLIPILDIRKLIEGN
ncbi:MAG: GNAT family N-acetyltransferase, partial [Pseudomonadota bacterium]